MDDMQNDYRRGSLPERYPLATALTPFQDSADPVFENYEALSRGTLFPGLELPFMDMVNTGLPESPLTELMAIDFVCGELSLYLDTHAEDREAFALLQTMLSMQAEARKRFAAMCGPVLKSDLLGAERYTWLRDPWPWDYAGRKER